MQQAARYLFTSIGIVLTIAAAGFFVRAGWAVALWPWPDGRLSFIFLASILAASAASLLYIGLSGDLRAAAPGSFNVLISSSASAAYFFLLFLQDPANLKLLLVSAGLLPVAGFALAVFLWAQRFPLRDPRPAGRLTRISFAVFAFFLGLASLMLILKFPVVFPWPLDPRSSVVFGLIFLGNFVYFLYLYLEPYRSMALGQWWGFLAYDLVLIVPFIQHISAVKPEHRLSLLIYVAVLVYSGVAAVITLLPRSVGRVAHPAGDVGG